MSDFLGIDFSEFDELAADLRDAGIKAAVNARPVVHRGANNIQRDARDLAPGGPTTPHYPESITYDVEIEDGMIVAEIGPDKDRRQGALGNLLEYGRSDRLPPRPHLGPAADREAPKFEHHMAEIGAKALDRR